MTRAGGVVASEPVVRFLDPTTPGAREIWLELERQAAPPYFLCWGWISTWLASLPPAETPRLGLLLVHDLPVAAFFLGRRHLLRNLFVASHALYLNATGRLRWDELTIEHNAVLCAPGTALTLAALVRALPERWDELFLPALARESYPGNALEETVPGVVVRIDAEIAAPYVDLAEVRAAPGGYLGLLRAGTRAQLRRTERGFGVTELEVAADARQALEIYGELVGLHTRTWRSRGLPGAFADPWFNDFHRKLIGERFDHGEVQLLRLRVRDGGATIGCLYNLVAGGRVLYYQGGFASFDDPRLKPGYLCHAAAVNYNASVGHAVYDLLGGDARYKSSLGTRQAHVVSARLQRRRVRFEVEELLRGWWRRARRTREVASPGAPAPASPD